MKKMSNRNQAPSAGGNDDKCDTRNPEMRVTQVEEAAGIIMMGHQEDARLNSNYRSDSNNYNSALLSEQVKAATRTAGKSSHAVANTNSKTNSPRLVGRHLCSHCSNPGHRHPECPLRPCKHCGVKGHVGINCPEMAEVRAQRRHATSRQWYDANRANRR